MGKRFECYTTLEEIEGDQARKIISSLKKLEPVSFQLRGVLRRFIIK